MLSVVPYIVLFSVVIICGLVAGYLKYKKIISRRNRKKAAIYGWDRIEVPLLECDIRHRQYYEDAEYEVLPGGIKMMDALLPDARNVTQKNKIISVVIFVSKNGSGEDQVYYSRPLNVPPERLRILFSQVGTAYLYVNPENRGEYYFDLDFVADEKF